MTSTALRPLVALLLGATLALPAAAQWQWIDRDGRKVFSDKPPPADIADKNILRRPGGRAAAPAAPPAAPAAEDAAAGANAAPGAATAAKPGAPKPTGQDKELLEKKKQADDAEAAKKKAEEERIAKVRAENCSRAKQAKSTLDSGMRIAQTNAQGERVILDDAARATEQRKVSEAIASECK